MKADVVDSRSVLESVAYTPNKFTNSIEFYSCDTDNKAHKLQSYCFYYLEKPMKTTITLYAPEVFYMFRDSDKLHCVLKSTTVDMCLSRRTPINVYNNISTQTVLTHSRTHC